MYKVFLYCLILLPAVAATAAPDGEALFSKHCSICHGENGEGGVGVPLSLPSFIDSVPDEFLSATIRNGRPGRIMPAFQQLSDAQLASITAYMRSWSDAAAPKSDPRRIKGDIAKGKFIFDRQCVQCHGEEGRGGHGTGVTFSRKRDLPIIAPALNNAGFLAAADDNMIKNTIMFGREGTPMTSALVAGLTEEDVNDVVAYIRSLEANHGQTDEQPEESAVIMVESDYSLEETIDNLKQAISDQNFTLIRTEYVDHGLVEPGKENKKQRVLHFCNFRFLFDALAIDPRVGLFLPCRVTVVEHEGKVKVMTINPLRLSKMFNNDELDDACKHMHEVYTSILEDAVL